MCSWCWGFRTTWNQVQHELTDKVNIQYVLGGLAPDNDQPMQESMQVSIRDNWRRIQQEIPGVAFNYNFWSECQARRSTYPACRAIIACGMQKPHLKNDMLLAIQQAYYLNAKNPSDDDVLIEIAKDLGLDSDVFASELNSDACRAELESDLLLTKKLFVNSFPSLILAHASVSSEIHIDYTSSENILQQIFQKLDFTY